jgi:hypothetical protein
MNHHRPRSPLEVEEELNRLAEALEAATEQYRNDALAAAEAEADYKLAYSRCLVGLANSGRKITAGEREARAIVSAGPEFRLWKIKEASRTATGEALRTYRTRIEALRTEAASRRFQG